MARTGRPLINFDRKQFIDLVALGCTQEEIFRLSGFTRDEFLDMMIKGSDGYSMAKSIIKV